MPPTPDDPLQSPQSSEFDHSITVAKTRPKLGKSQLSAVSNLPYRRSNASLSELFASTSSLPGTPVTGTRSGQTSGAATPTKGVTSESVLSPGTAGIKSPGSSVSGALFKSATTSSETRDLIIRAFAPHVSVLASQDTEELVRHKGINGGLLELLRPFGERVQGKVTIRDSVGVGRSWEEFGVRFMGVQDGLESPRSNERKSTDVGGAQAEEDRRAFMLEYKPARLRSGGDVPQVEELVERHLTFAEEQSGPIEADYMNSQDASRNPHAPSPFYMHYLRRLLSGLPMVPSETISHPVASIIAISSRSQQPIEELRNLFASSNAGEHRLPQWVHNEFLRYYVLVHDEDYDDITKSMTLFDQMKRHFGLHCHLLRLRSTQCVVSDDGAMKLPHCEWTSAAEELAEITRRETSDDEDLTTLIYESDATAIRAMVREMVTQSIIPSMERASATWNDQIASRRRGFSGRFMSLSKRFTGFGGRNSSVPALGGGGSNYDSLQGFYRPDTPEALMRKLVDYAMMLRDFKLAQSTCEILCQDYKTDKAWRYYAAANEMTVLSSLLASGNISNKTRTETIEQAMEAAYYSYITRVNAPYNALRTLLLGIELLIARGGSALGDASRWCTRILDDRLVGPVGYVLVMERIAACSRDRINGDRARKAAFWNFLAADAWLGMDKSSQAERCLAESIRLYTALDANRLGAETQSQNDTKNGLRFEMMPRYLTSLQQAIHQSRSGPQHLDEADLLAAANEASGGAGGSKPSNKFGNIDSLDGSSTPTIEAMQLDEMNAIRSPIAKAHAHRKSLSVVPAMGLQGTPALRPTGADSMGMDPLGATHATPTKAQDGVGVGGLGLNKEGPVVGNLSSVAERKGVLRDDGFE